MIWSALQGNLQQPARAVKEVANLGEHMVFDYEHELGVGLECVWGIKKSVFNSVDYATIVVSSYGSDS